MDHEWSLMNVQRACAAPVYMEKTKFSLQSSAVTYWKDWRRTMRQEINRKAPAGYAVVKKLCITLNMYACKL